MSAKVHNVGSGEWAFHCPGCGYGHSFRVTGDNTRPQWTWNGSLDRPTFHPSLLINRDHRPSRCHLFVTDGKIKYQPDCHHALAGKTVDMVDWD